MEDEHESAAVRDANKHFRREAQGAVVETEHGDQEAATRLKTAKLREQRLARDANVAIVSQKGVPGNRAHSGDDDHAFRGMATT